VVIIAFSGLNLSTHNACRGSRASLSAGRHPFSQWMKPATTCPHHSTRQCSAGITAVAVVASVAHGRSSLPCTTSRPQVRSACPAHSSHRHTMSCLCTSRAIIDHHRSSDLHILAECFILTSSTRTDVVFLLLGSHTSCCYTLHSHLLVSSNQRTPKSQVTRRTWMPRTEWPPKHQP
jgi:hypothetical protein